MYIKKYYLMCNLYNHCKLLARYKIRLCDIDAQETELTSF